MSRNLTLERGDIWLVNLDPTVGAEIKKIRPAVIVSANNLGKLPIKLVAPITDWKTYFDHNLWHIRVEPDSVNGLTKTSTVDVLQLRSIDTRRCVRKLGSLSDQLMQDVVTAIAAIIEYQED